MVLFINKRWLVVGVFLLFLSLSIFFTQGATANCSHSSSFTDCTTYGCFIIRNASDSPRLIWDAGGFIDITGTVYESYDLSSLAYASRDDFQIRNATAVAALFTIGGNIVLAGTLTDDTQTECNPPAKSFIIQNQAGECMGYIDSVGNMWLRGRICTDAVTTPG